MSVARRFRGDIDLRTKMVQVAAILDGVNTGR
jgi:hypothetical protein